MLLVTRNEETVLLSPSVCAICEQSPQPGTTLVDTLRNFNQGINGTGRKYVCESCVGELAAVMGLSSGHGERVAKAQNAAYAAAFETLKHQLQLQTKELVKLVNEPLSNLQADVELVVTAVTPDTVEVEKRPRSRKVVEA